MLLLLLLPKTKVKHVIDSHDRPCPDVTSHIESGRTCLTNLNKWTEELVSQRQTRLIKLKEETCGGP